MNRRAGPNEKMEKPTNRTKPKKRRVRSQLISVIAVLTLFEVGLLPPSLPTSFANQDTSYPMFSCETNRPGKFIQIRGVEDPSERVWSNIQYTFGRDGEPPEMVYPSDPAKGAKSLFFSHEYRDGGADYYVSIRFSTGGFTYRVFCHTGKGGAGVSVTDARGKVVSTIKCIERPSIYAAYLQRTLACDLKSPHGKAACAKDPYRPAR